MRLLLSLGLPAVMVAAGCATNRCNQCEPCCTPAMCAAPIGTNATTPATPVEPLEPAPEPPAASLRPGVEPATEPVSTVEEDHALYGRDPELRWLLGRLERIAEYGGAWRLRYATADTWDEHGASVILAPDVRLEGYRHGDFVYVRGEVISEPVNKPRGSLYRVLIIRPSTAGDRKRQMGHVH